MTITPEWMNYALIDSITDSFAPVILDVEMEAVYIDELSLIMKRKQQAEMLKRISRCRKQSTQLVRLLASKSDVIKSLIKRYEDRNRDLQKATAPQTVPSSGVNTPSGRASPNVLDSQKTFSDVVLYLGDIQGSLFLYKYYASLSLHMNII